MKILKTAAVIVAVLIAGNAIAADRQVAGRSLDAWQQALGSPKRTERLRAALTLPQFGRDAIPTLRGALDHKDPGVRYWAASGLGDLGFKQAAGGKPSEKTTIKLATMLGDKSVGLRISAAYALCRLGSIDKGLPVLIKALEHPHRGVACSAADFLARIGAPAAAAVPALQQAARHKDYHVQGASSEALRRIKASGQERRP